MQDSRVMVREHIDREWGFCLGIFKDLNTASKWCKEQQLEKRLSRIELSNLQKWIKENEEQV